MILLDTDYLIRALVTDSVESERIVDWFEAGEDLCTSSIAWYEFLCGPVDDEGVLVAQSLLQETPPAGRSDDSRHRDHRKRGTCHRR